MPADDDVLTARLLRLAPVVDVDAALRLLPLRRRRLPAVLAVAAALLVLLGAVAGVRQGGDEGRPLLQTGPPPSATATADGVTLTVTASAPAYRVGTRIRVSTVVVNDGSRTIVRESGGCSFVGSPVLAIEDGDRPVSAASGDLDWDGAPSSLASAVGAGSRSPQSPATLDGFVTVGSAGVRNVGCTLESRTDVIGVGDRRTFEGELDLRPTGAEALDHSTLSARFDYRIVTGGDASPEAASTPAPPLAASVLVPVEDDPDRVPGRPAAIDAFAKDARLRRYVADTVSDPPTTGTLHDWRLDLSWWRGAWELYVLPRNGAEPSLRLRASASGSAVADARLVGTGRQDDDPDGPSPRSEYNPPDTVLKP